MASQKRQSRFSQGPRRLIPRDERGRFIGLDPLEGGFVRDLRTRVLPDPDVELDEEYVEELPEPTLH